MPSGRRLYIQPNLRVADLKKRSRSAPRLTNIKVPAEVGEAVRLVAERLGATKTEVVTALLNHGLQVAGEALRKLPVQSRLKIVRKKGTRGAQFSLGKRGQGYA